MNHFVMKNIQGRSHQQTGSLPDFLYFLLWLILFNMIIFVSFIAIDNNYLTKVIEADRSRISLLIALVFFATSLYAGTYIFRVGKYLKHVESLIKNETTTSKSDIEPETHDMITHYIHEMSAVNSQGAHKNQQNPGNDLQHTKAGGIDKSSYIFEIYVDQLRAPSEVLSFVIDVLIRLGLIGTIIGFILMLQSFVSGPSPSAENIQELLITMSTGMGTALYTTFAGLVASTLLGMQQLLLNRNVEQVVAGLIRISDSSILHPSHDKNISTNQVTG